MPSAEELFQERRRRIQAAIALEVPDRVPIWFQDLSFFPARYAGITFEEAMYDSQKLFSAYRKTIVELEPDLYFNPGHAIHTPGDALEALDCKQVRWPGGGLAPNRPFQFVEGEYLRADEYDHILEDPSDFVVRTYLPRVFGKLEVFAQLPPLKTLLLGYFGVPVASLLAMPVFAPALEAFAEGARSGLRHQQANAEFQREMREAGFPCSMGGITLAPFDLVSDLLRGMRGTMLDMYRRPESLLALIDLVTPMLIEVAVMGARASGNPGVFVPLHRGSDGFLSPEQFETFYWPGLKMVLLALIEEGLTPCPFFEGDHGSRLELYAELPKGKMLGLFDGTDPYRAKEILGGTMCISGMMPLSLLQIGPPEVIRDYAKKLIDVVGKDGGFVMGPRSAMDEADPELVKVWVDFTKEYGVYH